MWKYVLPLAGKCLHLEIDVSNELLHSVKTDLYVYHLGPPPPPPHTPLSLKKVRTALRATLVSV